ncbi:MAG TPA: cyclic pyranopterin monophosphate synthase MoaC [Limnochordales bacterium]|nr:cyclic pyranopterin monophosphate synthase MoaC [Limnochordales bacterium]
MASEFTHLNDQGLPRMVDVGDKEETHREAVARGRVCTTAAVVAAIREGRVKKGAVLPVAQVAGIMAAKRTADWIPLCHPLPLTGVDMAFELDEERGIIDIEARVRTRGRTGVEMEALAAVAAAALTLYDMCKALDRSMTISDIRLEEKRGGKGGAFVRGTGARVQGDSPRAPGAGLSDPPGP